MFLSCFLVKIFNGDTQKTLITIHLQMTLYSFVWYRRFCVFICFCFCDLFSYLFPARMYSSWVLKCGKLLFTGWFCVFGYHFVYQNHFVLFFFVSIFCSHQHSYESLRNSSRRFGIVFSFVSVVLFKFAFFCIWFFSVHFFSKFCQYFVYNCKLDSHFNQKNKPQKWTQIRLKFTWIVSIGCYSFLSFYRKD